MIYNQDGFKCTFVTKTLAHPDGIIIDCTKEVVASINNAITECNMLKKRLNKAEYLVMELRKELYKVGGPDFYKKITDPILNAIKGIDD